MTFQNQPIASTENATYSVENSPPASETNLQQILAGIVKRCGKDFWGYTDKMGRTNTSRFDGLL